MAKKNDDKRLLDNWVPPGNSGVAIGCLATTYTFQSDFFEEECLTRFLSIESKPDEDGPVYLIEREEKLNNISCAAVWVDQAWAKQKRNLRWDLVPVRLSKGILHSKISVLQWANCVRVIVGSANLTETAYRRNQEIFAVIDVINKPANKDFYKIEILPDNKSNLSVKAFTTKKDLSPPNISNEPRWRHSAQSCATSAFRTDWRRDRTRLISTSCACAIN